MNQNIQEHLKKWWPPYAFAVVLVLFYNPFWRVGLNYSDSSPYHLFIVSYHADYGVGNQVAVSWKGPDFSGHHKNDVFIKTVGGVEGDLVENKDGVFFVGGKEIGPAQPKASDGTSLEPGPTGLIPAGRVFLSGHHRERSFDSRYALMGWVHKSEVLGRAYPIF